MSITKSRKFITFFASAILFGLPVEASVKDKVTFKVDKFTLENGLTFLVHENHAMPIVSYQQWFRVGSSYEKPGRTGLAHFFEHLMFKGTPRYPNGEIDRIIQMNGGAKNAFTTSDYTGYYTNLPSDKLDLIMDVESDRMVNLIFDEKEINSEREVVKEERRMRYENSVFGSLYLLVRSTLFKKGPYSWPVIGYMKDLNAAKLDEFKDFYKTYYAPNNAVIVVAGDVTLSQVKKMAEKYYGHIPRQNLPEFKPQPEEVQKMERNASLTKDVQGATVAVVYPGVVSGHADSHALDLMAEALGSGTSSRLYKNLVYKSQIATQASASSSNDKLAGDISFYISLKPGVSSSSAVQAVEKEVAHIKKELIAPEELEKLKNTVILSYVNGLQTMESRARSLAVNEIVFGDYSRLFDDLDKYEQVSREDIQRVANTYLISSKRNVVKLLPKH